MINKITILGVNISQITKKDAIKTVEHWLSSGSVIARTPKADAAISSHFIVTPNPEMLVLAQKDKEFKDVLNIADLAIPDGIGLVWASSNKLSERVSGTDLMLDLCELASQKGYTIGLLGAGEGVAKKTAEVLEKKFKGIKIKFTISELSKLSLRGRSGATDEAISKNDVKRLPRSAAYGVLARNDKMNVDFLFVAFGAPKQEKFIWEQLNYSSNEVRSLKDSSRRALHSSNNNTINFRIGMGVGGAFDLISGKIKRAPKMMRDLGLEWLWRLIQEPKRFKRIWTATVVFPWLVVKSFFKSQPQSDVSSDWPQN